MATNENPLLVNEKNTSTQRRTTTTKKEQPKKEEVKSDRVLSGFFFSFPLSTISEHLLDPLVFIEKVKAHNIAHRQLLPGLSPEDTVRVWYPAEAGQLHIGVMPSDTYIQGVIAFHEIVPASTLPFQCTHLFGLPLRLLWDKKDLSPNHEKITIDKLYPDIEQLHEVYFEKFLVSDAPQEGKREAGGFKTLNLDPHSPYRHTIPWYFRGAEEEFAKLTIKHWRKDQVLEFFVKALTTPYVERTKLTFEGEGAHQINLTLEQVLEQTKDRLSDQNYHSIINSLKTVAVMRDLITARDYLRGTMEPFIHNLQYSLVTNQATDAGTGQR